MGFFDMVDLLIKPCHGFLCSRGGDEMIRKRRVAGRYNSIEIGKMQAGCGASGCVEA
jgi:hypothetical protein